MLNKRGQVWIETVIYTLIAFVMIGAVLAFAKPKIEEMQDKAIIEQTIQVLENMNTIILDARQVSGNQRIFELGIKKGSLIIDAEHNKIYFEIESKYQYSQPGETIQSGSVQILTSEVIAKRNNLITLTLDYSNSNYDMILKGGEDKKQITKASSLYKIFVINKGKPNLESKTQLEFEVG